MQYPLIFTPEDGDIVVRSRDFPELLTSGETDAEALENAEDALAVVVLKYIEKGLPLPQVTSPEEGERIVYLPAQEAAKAAVIQAFKEAGITKTELANRMEIGENEARRILDPDYGTKLDKLDAAARAMGRRIIVDLAA